MTSGILTIAGKEFRHFLHDPLSLALMLGLPIFQLIFYGYALDTRVRHVPAAVVNHDAHQGGRRLVERLSHGELFVVNPALRDPAAIQSALRSGAIRMAIEIPEDYTVSVMYHRKTAIRVWVDGADVMVSSYVLSALDALGVETPEVYAASPPSALTNRVELQARVLFNPGGSTAVFIIPGLIAILIQTITMVLVALSIAGERERGTLEQVLITPIGVNAIIFGKALAIGLVGLVESCVLTWVMHYLFGIAVQGSTLLLVSVLPILVLAPIGLGLLISAVARNTLQALQLAFFLTLLSELLSGFVLAKEFLARPLAWFSDFLPATYSIGIERNIILRGASLSEIAPAVAIGALFGMALLVSGWYACRKSLLSKA